jgi:hypothetical protein
MKYHNHQEGSAKYLFFGLLIAMLTMALLADPGSLRIAVANTENEITTLFHFLAG